MGHTASRAAHSSCGGAGPAGARLPAPQPGPDTEHGAVLSPAGPAGASGRGAERRAGRRGGATRGCSCGSQRLMALQRSALAALPACGRQCFLGCSEGAHISRQGARSEGARSMRPSGGDSVGCTRFWSLTKECKHILRQELKRPLLQNNSCPAAARIKSPGGGRAGAPPCGRSASQKAVRPPIGVGRSECALQGRRSGRVTAPAPRRGCSLPSGALSRFHK